MLSPFEKNIHQYIKQNVMWKVGETLLVSVSGGIDSMVLIHVLYELRSLHKGILHVMTFDHGIREESSTETKMVEEFCLERNIPCEIVDLHLQKQSNFMEEARDQRRFFLEQCNTDRIVTGHHMNDQAETMLYRMLRGSGLDGVSGMLPVQGKYCRPLLGVTKEEITQYAISHHIPFCNDPSNSDSLRGKIRQIFSQLDTLHGSSIRCFAQSSRSLALDSDFLQQHINFYWENWKPWLKGIPVSQFIQVHPAIQMRLLRKYLQHHNIPIRYKQLEKFLSSPLHNNHKMSCANGSFLLVKNNHIVAIKNDIL